MQSALPVIVHSPLPLPPSSSLATTMALMILLHNKMLASRVGDTHHLVTSTRNWEMGKNYETLKRTQNKLTEQSRVKLGRPVDQGVVYR